MVGHIVGPAAAKIKMSSTDDGGLDVNIREGSVWKHRMRAARFKAKRKLFDSREKFGLDNMHSSVKFETYLSDVVAWTSADNAKTTWKRSEAILAGLRDRTWKTSSLFGWGWAQFDQSSLTRRSGR